MNVVHISLQNNSTRSIYGKSAFQCKTPDSDKALTAKSNGFKLYYETQTLTERFVVPDELDLSKCSSLELELFSIRDPEYKNNPITTIKLK